MEAYTETCTSGHVTKQLSIHVQLDCRKAATRMQPLAITPCENGINRMFLIINGDEMPV